MSIVSSRPLTKLKQEAGKNQQSFKAKQQELHQREIHFRHRMASTIQRGWRRYVIQKQQMQQKLIHQLILNINELSSEVTFYQSKNGKLKQQLQGYEIDYEELVRVSTEKEIERTNSVFKKTLNSGLQNEIELAYVEGQLRISKQNYSESQKILDDLIECGLVLQRQEEEIRAMDRENQLRVKELEERIGKENLQINHLEFQQQELLAARGKKLADARFRQYMN